ncbi:MAG: DUF4239 domain-containing protein [Candidatus Eremiobacteraeota bacterium]|nr:DUF4239 domain-containing protein [Candidatus Eremiobacteraeota bacterium]
MLSAMIVVAFVCFFALYGAIVWLVRRFVKGHVREGHNDVLVPLFLTAGTLYAVLLAFLVIAVWETHGAADDNASEEASTLATLYRQTAGMPSREQRDLRALLREYTVAVVTDEWPVQARTGGRSAKARVLVTDIYAMLGHLNPADRTSPQTVEFLRTFGVVAADRNRRGLQANQQLPSILWIGLLVGAGIIVAMSFFLYMDVFWPHFVMSGLMTGLILTLLLITFMLNRPFNGPMGIDAGAFENATSVYDAVDRGR